MLDVQPNQPPAPKEPTSQHFVIYQYPSGQTDIHMPVDPIVAFKLLAVACESLSTFHLQLRQQQQAEEQKQQQSRIEVVGRA